MTKPTLSALTRLTALALLILGPWNLHPASIFSTRQASGNVAPERIQAARASLERMLEENILPFWFPNVLDRERGGYHLHHDLHGRSKGPGTRALVSQARTVWFFSHLALSNRGSAAHLAAARHGYAYLRDHLWDSEHGGFYWEVDPRTFRPTRPDKHLYGQAFGLYALSEFALASEDEEALRLAHRLFALLEYRAYDHEFGGYRESFLRDWSEPPETAISYMGVPASWKLMNTHLHLMEALTAYVRAGGGSTARDRLSELVAIQANTVVRKGVTACTDKYSRSWTPLSGGEFDRVSYGHDLENVWLIGDALEALQRSPFPYLDLFRSLFDYSLANGFDRERGGFYDSGPLGMPADHRDKIWWVQAEALVGSLRMYLLTGEERFFEVFEKTWAWVTEHQADWQGGDWFATVTPEGEVEGDKAGPWKSPYHNGRAVLECLRLLERLP